MSAQEILADLKSRQITDSDSLIGKTITDVSEDNGMLLLFSDQTWALITYERDWDGDTEMKIETDTPDWKSVSIALSEEQMDMLTKHEEEQRRATNERRRLQDAAERRQKYEQLKAEFERT